MSDNTIAVSEVFKRVQSHSNVIGLGMISPRGELLSSSGTFDAALGRRAARLVAVATSTLEQTGEDDENSIDTDAEVVRARRGNRELVVARCDDVILAVLSCARHKPKSAHHFGALTHEERVKVLGEAVLRSGAIVFTKNHAGKYTAVNDDYLAAFGFDDSSDVVGKSDDEIVETLLGRGQTFHHSYRGESITDLPAIWRAHDEMALERPMWFKERSLLGGGVDTKLHEFVVMKAPFEDGIIGVAVSEGT